MTNTQIALVQIDNYGPWTVTPEPRPEPDLQALQADLYADLARLVGSRDGYVFYTRFDNMVAVTNGLDVEDHARIQESVANRYPVTVSVGIGTGARPAEALGDATARIQQAGSAQDRDRQEVLDGEVLAPGDRTDGDVRVAHFDVVDATGKYTDRLNAFDTFLELQAGYLELARYMRREHDSLSFFVGGDNVISVCSDLEDPDFQAAVDYVTEAADIELQVGVGTGATAQAAGMGAKHALERCRRSGTRVERSAAAVHSD